MEKNYLVYYSKDFAASCLGDQEVKADPIGIIETHTPVRVMSGENLDDVYMSMQGEMWSPNGEANPMILGLGLRHTSMSVGDILYDIDSRIFYKCAMSGWDTLS